MNGSIFIDAFIFLTIKQAVAKVVKTPKIHENKKRLYPIHFQNYMIDYIVLLNQ